ncbi:LysR substrate-binding domain-containing protein [Rhodococcus gannanensis]|uniref:LysR substrate-binding domain-containing protein n=1 Tax=Rhodococcus gannanensis TaxID=1960308 RepID=A0ABW4PFI3_9NOCA
MLNVMRLRMLCELQRRGTLAEVAYALSYTPSAVSQQLSLLERETGVTLFERVGRGVRLTDDAVGLVAHAEAVLARLEQAESELAAAQPHVRGTLRVASFQTVVVELVPPALTLLAERHPQLQVEIAHREVGPAYEGLLSHRFDVILGEEYPGLPGEIRSGVDRQDLVRDRLCLAVPAVGRWSASPSVLADLTTAPWAMDPPATPTGDWSRAVCRTAGFEPRIAFENADPLLQAHLVRSGHAVAFIPALIAGRHGDGVQLIGLPGDPHRTLHTAVRAGRAGHPAVRAFRAALAEVASERVATPLAGWLAADGS